MDVLSEEEKTLQAYLGPGLGNLDGLDNEGIDLNQLEEFIQSEGFTNDMSNLPTFEDPCTTQHLQCQLPRYPVSSTNTGVNGHGMDSHGNGNHGNLKGSPQRVPPQHPQGPPQHAQQGHSNPIYNQAQGNVQNLLNHQKNQQYCNNPQLPDSPPDSGSEPYSPPDGTQNHTDSNVNYNVKSNMTSLQQQQMYMNPHHHPPINSVTPPTSQQSPPHQQPPTAHSNHNAHNTPKGYCGPAEPPKLNHLPPPPMTLNPQMLQMASTLPPYNGMTMNNLQNQPNKKRKYESPNASLTPGLMNSMGLGHIPLSIKHEPVNHATSTGMLPDCDDDSYFDYSQDVSGSFLDSSYQVIKWQNFNQKTWCSLLDENYKEIPPPSYRVDADKGFNFSVPDDSFVCQKKNHFQVTVHMELHGRPKYIKTPEGAIKQIESYFVHFYGIKMESQNQHIKIEQSQSDRSKKRFYPVRVDLQSEQMSKVTVGRLHFSETTSNNMRKKGKPNPDQRYFMLVVALNAHIGDEPYMLASQVSEKIIVRASNPGQFDSDVDVLWQKGHTPESVYHAGRVGINTDRPDEALTVHGNLKVTGHVIQPSDIRAKQNITERSPREQMKNISKLKVYDYEFKENFAEYAGMSDDERKDTGVIAQEVSRVLPDAVCETGDIVLPDGNKIERFQVVNKDRIYMENVGAVKELCKVTDKLENRINELEIMKTKLSRSNNINKRDSMKSTCSSKSFSTCSISSSIPPATTKADDKKSQSKNRNRHGNSRLGGGGEDSGPCSNRIIQITVVVLVLVMAFCLISITTLYILERKSPGTDQPSESLHTTTPRWPHPIPGRNGSDPAQFDVDPLTPPRCETSHCDPFCCYSVSPTPLTPLNDPANVGKDDKTVKPGQNNENESIDKGDGKPSKVIPPYKILSTLPPAVVVNDVRLQDSERSNDTPKGDPYVVMHEPEVHPNGVLSRRRRGIEDEIQDDLGSVPLNLSRVDITVKQLRNHTLDKKYCFNPNCHNGEGGNYTYIVPLSTVFPTVFITIKFKLDENNLRAVLCEEIEPHSHACKLQSADNEEELPLIKVNSVGNNEYELPVGYYDWSMFTFRVAPYALADSHICRLDTSQVNYKFAEYQLTFHRLKDDSC